MTILRENVTAAAYDFGIGHRESVEATEAAHHKVTVAGRYVAIDDDSDVRGVMVQRPNGTWHQLRESEVLDLDPSGNMAFNQVLLSRLDRTSGNLRLAFSDDVCDIPSMRSTVRPFGRIEFNTQTHIDSLNQYYVHMPRIRAPLMRWSMRVENGASAGTVTFQGHGLRYEDAETNIAAPSVERGPEDTSLEESAMSGGAVSLTNSAVDTVSGLIEGWFDVVEFQFSTGNHQGIFVLGWS